MGRLVTQKQLDAALEQQKIELINLLTPRKDKETMAYKHARFSALVDYVHNLDTTESSQEALNQQYDNSIQSNLEKHKDWIFGG